MNSAQNDTSLSEVNATVDTTKAKSGWRRAISFLGPAYLVSVGYMDPGNWATDLAGGSQFGYTLIWVLVMSNLMALLLQSLCSRLGIVRKRDLAQCNRETYPRWMNFILYILAELAIAATDLAEILGMAIGLQLLLDIPLMWGVLITLLDTFLLLYLQRLGIRKMEAFIIALIAVIGLSFLIELILAKPDFGAIATGLKPTIPNNTALYIAIGIIGATVMPHNLYLHSSLVQTRKVGNSKASIKQALKMNTIDSAVALNMALFVNAAILILAASVFHTSGNQEVASLHEAHQLLTPLLGSEWASHLFAIALIAAGQSSTITGTLSGQIVMEGYLRLRLNPILRRLLTRLIAIVPAVIVIGIMGEEEVDNMLVFSQVLLSMQLAFAVIPLILFVSDREKMGEWVIKPLVKTLAWTIAAIIVALNLKLIYETGQDWIGATNNLFIKALIIFSQLGILILLIATIVVPGLNKKKLAYSSVHKPSLIVAEDLQIPQHFSRIGLALDFSSLDKQVLQYALQQSQPDTRLYLLHVVQSVPAQMRGENAEDAETYADKEQLQKYQKLLQEKGRDAEIAIGYNQVRKELPRLIKEHNIDLLVVGAHGHKGISDLVYGETINTLRHQIDIPMMIVKNYTSRK